VEVLPGSDLVGNSLGSSGLTDRYDLDVIGIHRATRSIEITPGTLLEEHDVLLVRAALDTIRRIQDDPQLQLRPEAKIELSDLVSGGMLLAEALVPPGSPLDGRTLQQTGFRKRYGVTALALFHHREYIQERVGRIRLHIGDMLLLYGSKENLRELAGFSEVVSVVKVLPPRPRRSRSRLALVIVAATVGAAASGSVSLEIASVAGAALMVMTGCLNLRETYRAMDRRTILLLAGMISLGLSLERSGAAAYLAESILSGAGSLGPLTLLAATYLATIMITELLTNNACAVIMTPIAIATAEGFGLDPRPFAFAVAYGASASFLTPFGYQTNMFVYGAGGYRFIDFARVGFPLTLITFLVSMLLIPYLWPLTP
jgi:di/tricarboxylate transporter